MKVYSVHVKSFMAVVIAQNKREAFKMLKERFKASILSNGVSEKDMEEFSTDKAQIVRYSY